MNVSTEVIGPADVRGLISSTINGTIPSDQVESFMRVVRSSASIWVGFIDRNFVCVWGLAPPTFVSEEAYLWLYTTDALKGHEFAFIRRSQIAVGEMLKLYPRIVGHVERGNLRAKRWLQWLGARFGQSHTNLIPFMIEAEK